MFREIENAMAAYWVQRNSLVINPLKVGDEDSLLEKVARERLLVTKYKGNPASVKFRTKEAEALVKASVVSGRVNVPVTLEDVVNHEMGHVFEIYVEQAANYEKVKANMSKYAERISGYATADFGEYVAESFASYRKGENIIDPELEKFFMSLEK